MRSTVSRPEGVRSLALLDAFTALLLVVISVLLVNFALLGVTGGGALALFGLVEFVLGLLSFAGIGGLWMGKKWAWMSTIVISTVAVLLNATMLALAATLPLTVSFPGGPIVLLILANDIIIAEFAVVYFVSKPSIKSHLGKTV